MLITSSIWQFYLFTAIKRQLYQALLQHFMIYLRSSESRSNLLYLLFDQHTTEQIKIRKLFRAFRKRFWYLSCSFFLVLIYDFGICYAVAMLKWPVSTGYEILWQIYWNSFILLLNFAVISVLHKSNVKMKTKRGKYYWRRMQLTHANIQNGRTCMYGWKQSQQTKQIASLEW